MSAFFQIHRGLPREAPGDAASIAWATGMAGLRRDGTVLDAGCGPGADIPALLSAVPQGQVHAVDLHPPFAQVAKARFGHDPRVRVEVADFTRLAGGAGRYDLIWSAGAVYLPGLAPSLLAFRPMLKPGGRVAFTDACWLGEDRPAAAAAFWAREYPAMPDLPALHAAIGACGFRVLGHRTLGPAAWEAYYRPLEARLDALEPGADAELAEAIAAHREEIAVWRAHGDAFGYVLFVVAP